MNPLKFELGICRWTKIRLLRRAGDILNILIKMQNPLNELPADLKSVEFNNKQITIRVTTKPAIKGYIPNMLRFLAVYLFAAGLIKLTYLAELIDKLVHVPCLQCHFPFAMRFSALY